MPGILDQSAVWVDEMNYYDMRTDRNKGISPLSLRPSNPLGIELDKYEAEVANHAARKHMRAPVTESRFISPKQNQTLSIWRRLKYANAADAALGRVEPLEASGNNNCCTKRQGRAKLRPTNVVYKQRRHSRFRVHHFLSLSLFAYIYLFIYFGSLLD